jgi:hypothetical protein
MTPGVSSLPAKAAINEREPEDRHDQVGIGYEKREFGIDSFR